MRRWRWRRRRRRPAMLMLGTGFVFVFAACRDDSEHTPAARSIAPELLQATTMDAAAFATRPDDPHTVALARDARDAATKLASVCWIRGQFFDGADRRYYDSCSWKPAEIEPLRWAATSLAAARPDAGAGAIFAEHVRLFAEWIEMQPKTSSSRPGTLEHYQDLALAWNAYQPQEVIPVDVGDSRNAYFGLLIPDGGLPDGGHLVWQQCSDGACIVVPEKKSRR